MNSGLFKKTEEDYGTEYKNHLFEQYKLFIESAERVSDRRQSANNYFLAINTAIFSFLGLIYEIKLKDISIICILLSIVGIFICGIFFFLINSYKQLNSGKFKVIHEIEQKLPLALYQREWEILGEGKNKCQYWPFSHIEIKIPFIFGLIYLILLIIYILTIVHKL
jgi:hypothetical protein